MQRDSATIIGIDEVGRGAWAGPVVAAAVVLPAGFTHVGLRDSKRMTAAARARANRAIRAGAVGIGLGWVAPALVDEFGLSWAVRQSGLRALEALLGEWAGGHFLPGSLVMLDGSHNYLAGSGYPSQALVRADDQVLAVSAAAVVAKVARDHYLAMLDRRHPGYAFANHKGYGTAAHQAALHKLGPCREHRRSYAPLRQLLTGAGAGA